jgi:DNA-directed RNA polymerase subunit beta
MTRTSKPVGIKPRFSFARIPEVIGVPDLIRVQKESYERFLQRDMVPEKRADTGLHGIFRSIFPIADYNKTATLEYVGYVLDDPKYDVEECRQRGITYAAPMRVTVRLVMWDVDSETAIREIRDVKEQEVYFGEIPLMTDQGTFIINGAERVVVSQLHRSPGVFFENDKGRTHASGKLLYSARIIPNRGSWVDFEFDHKDIMWVRIDRRRKIHATVLLKALGFSTNEIMTRFHPIETIRMHADGSFSRPLDVKLLEGQRLPFDVVAPKSPETVLVKRGEKLGKARLKRMVDAGIQDLPMARDEVIGKILADDVIDENTGEIVFECNQEITEKVLLQMQERGGVDEIKALYIDEVHFGPYLRNTLMADKVETHLEAAVEIYRRQRPGDPTSPEQARAYFNSLFFSSARYDLSPVGRLKMNFKFGESVPLDQTTLLKDDFFHVIQYLLDLRLNKSGVRVDDIDQLSNRRVRAVGELMENQFRIGMVRMERAIREKMTMSPDLATMMPHDLVNAKPVSAVLKEYFGASQLSQFMDQTNPLSEITNKRRLSALGPGGLTRDRAGFEVRDVHATHYGRVCPIETPEGPNIGLISSLATFARVNDFGFIETPYRKVLDRKVTDEVAYLTAMEEETETIAQAGVQLDKDGRIVEDLVQARRNEEFVLSPADEVTLIDVSPAQLVSVAAALVPFLEHDDANRALMGSNMMRQGVPLIRAEAPLVGTGLEWVVARDSGNLVYAKNGGVIESVDANRIVVRREGEDIDGETLKPDIYTLVKYRRSNQNTCINQKPIVAKGQKVALGQVLADGAATEGGELALGQNITVAFMPWGGYNFEDSILMSEKLVQQDFFTSIHIEEFEAVARDTKLGREEITRDIPNVSEEALKDLDPSGIVRIGAEVKTGFILVGKITPKGETQLSPEEKLLRAIFGEKAADVKDSSLRVPPGVTGIVVGAKVFSRKGADKDDRTRDLEEIEENRLKKDRDDEIRVTTRSMQERLVRLLTGKTAAAAVVDSQGRTLIRKGATLTEDVVAKLPLELMGQVKLKNDDATESRVLTLLDTLNDQIGAVTTLFSDKISRLRRGDELPPGVIKTIKVYVAIKRKIQVGDKMAGRHGNKGVLSRLLPVEDMPYLPDGRPVDIVLNPLGVPSRMNVGQILETHLGWAARELGRKIDQALEAGGGLKGIRKQLQKTFSTDSMKKMIGDMDDDELRTFAGRFRMGIPVGSPVFDGAFEDEIHGWLADAGLPLHGKTVLFDGRTGEAFDNEVTVGIMYMMKLHHLVDEKMHARSTGPYSLVTQQPLGGKAQFGGQRVGEMEVWSFEAYGAAYALQEILTVKSDDVAGRTATYDSIVKGDYNVHAGLPESFNVLVKEMKSLAIDVSLVEADQLAEGAPG